jgi:hypothetical protein
MIPKALLPTFKSGEITESIINEKLNRMIRTIQVGKAQGLRFASVSTFEY